METEPVCETSVYLNGTKQPAAHEVLLNFVATEFQEIRLIIMFRFCYLKAEEFLLQHEPKHCAVCSMSVRGSIQ